MQNTQNEFIIYKEIQKNTMLKWLFDSKISILQKMSFLKNGRNM